MDGFLIMSIICGIMLFLLGIIVSNATKSFNFGFLIIWIVASICPFANCLFLFLSLFAAYDFALDDEIFYYDDSMDGREESSFPNEDYKLNIDTSTLSGRIFKALFKLR